MHCMIEPRILHIPYRLIFALSFLVLVAATAQAQPFTTDDADTTPKRKFHLQIGNEYDILQRSEYPALRQNTTNFEIEYGLFDRVEIGFATPMLAISNSHIVTPKTPFGLGDSTLHLKYNFYKEREKSRLPAMAIAFASFSFQPAMLTRGLGQV